MSIVVTLPQTLLDGLRAEARAASWFAALGEPLTEGYRDDAGAYVSALGFGVMEIGQARDWPDAERLLSAIIDDPTTGPLRFEAAEVLDVERALRPLGDEVRLAAVAERVELAVGGEGRLDDVLHAL